ncbi:glycerate kinase [Microcella frigidaquae]|uniref:Glycerate kinase n=1 Tax=Microcella frigidaquae TaxID=424758 RepID=A0A840XCA5_9MICO|nr:glycerate kinase [Microcella frigidaquae]NHN44099.1 glycerate kinase [Microcella frigidaquae]
MRRIVIAPDSFKGSIAAREAARAIADGWQRIRPDDALLLVPQADGGEGTLDAIAAARPDARWRTAEVAGPTGEPHTARWLLLPGGQAVVEVAESCGITLLPRDASGNPRLAALTASTRGLGETLVAALDAGAEGVTIALGSSASTDGGLGALAALGLQLRDAAGATLPDGGGALGALAAIDDTGLRAAPPRGVTLLTDTTARLTGLEGAAVVFGPQKGAGPADVALLDAGLARAATLAGGSEHVRPGAGAAGGTAWGFLRYWGASIRSGAETVAAITGLDQALEGADLVITGEGRFDATSLRGKVVGSAIERAGAAGVDVAIVAGQADPAAAAERRVITLTALAGSSEAAIADPTVWLRDAGAELARALEP